jgi:hypothetical protein
MIIARYKSKKREIISSRDDNLRHIKSPSQREGGKCAKKTIFHTINFFLLFITFCFLKKSSLHTCASLTDGHDCGILSRYFSSLHGRQERCKFAKEMFFSVKIVSSFHTLICISRRVEWVHNTLINYINFELNKTI